MKPKIFLILSAACFFVSTGILIGVVVVSARAQNTPEPSYPPSVMWVKFIDDFMREHGKQVKSYFIARPSQPTWIYVDTIPSNKRFIVTDLLNSEGNSGEIELATDEQGTVKKGGVYLGPYVNLTTSYASLNSGISFEPGEALYVYNINQEFTICGYFVDL